jgi:hypothetical protein
VDRFGRMIACVLNTVAQLHGLRPGQSAYFRQPAFGIDGTGQRDRFQCLQDGVVQHPVLLRPLGERPLRMP